MTHRHKRVQVAIHRFISAALQEGDFSGADWKISVTRVDLSPDLHFARVFYSHIDGEPGRAGAEEFFRENQGRLKRYLASRLRLRRQPGLQFAWDTDFLEAEKVDRIIADIEEGRIPPSESG